MPRRHALGKYRNLGDPARDSAAAARRSATFTRTGEDRTTHEGPGSDCSPGPHVAPAPLVAQNVSSASFRVALGRITAEANSPSG